MCLCVEVAQRERERQTERERERPASQLNSRAFHTRTHTHTHAHTRTHTHARTHDPNLQDLIKAMLEPNPKRRPTVAELLKHPWIARRDTVPGSVHRQGTLEELRKFNARRKLKVWGGMTGWQGERGMGKG